jgi:hypothetical protein
VTKAEAARLMASLMPKTPKRCETWPDCYCGERVPGINVMLEEIADPATPPTREEIDELKGYVFVILNCIAKCTDRTDRRKAQVELQSPVFAEDWRIEMRARERWRRRWR